MLPAGQPRSQQPSGAMGGGPPLPPRLPPRLLAGLLLLALLGGALAAPPSPAPTRRGSSSCPRDWLHYRGFCYGYFTERRTWAEAENDCSRYGPRGHLASLHGAGDSKALARYLYGQANTDNIWMGLWDQEHSRQWQWSDNSVLNYKRWAWGQPNNLWDREDCAVLDKGSGFELWHDYPCDYRFPFLCQYQL